MGEVCDVIESLLIDEYRAHLAEDYLRGQFKHPPDSSEERVEQMLSRIGRPVRGRGGGMSLERARAMQADAERYDREVTKN